MRRGSQQTFLAPSPGTTDFIFPLPAGKAVALDYIMVQNASQVSSPAQRLDSGVPIPQCLPPGMSPFHCLGSLGERVGPAFPPPIGLCSLGGGGEALSREMNSWPDPRCQPAQLCSRVTLGAHTAPLYAWAPCPPWAWHQLYQQQWLRQLLCTLFLGPMALGPW